MDYFSYMQTSHYNMFFIYFLFKINFMMIKFMHMINSIIILLFFCRGWRLDSTL